MVHLILSSPKGNQGLRFFPYTGYLGLTPVTVEGVVRTKLDDDHKKLLAKSLTISIRCYESRLGRVSPLRSNLLVDHTQVLWSKPDAQDYAPIKEFEFPFRISIPAKVAGFSTAVFVDYRCMWRIEAVLNHVPVPSIGSRLIKHFELPLVRFDVPEHPLTSFKPTESHLQHQTTKPKAPKIRYSFYPPTSPIGPLDIVSIPIFLLPLDSDCVIRSATVTVERRIQLNDVTGSTSSLEPSISSLPILLPRSSSSPTFPTSSPYPISSFCEDSSLTLLSGISDISSDRTIIPYSVSSSEIRPLLPSHEGSLEIPSSSPLPHLSPKIVINEIVGVGQSGHFTRNDEGVWSKTVTLQWPAAKSYSRWGTGETIQSELVSIKFFARVKITVNSPSGTDSIELAEGELLVISTNETERQLALAKYNDLLSTLHPSEVRRSKSKSPRRSRRDREVGVLPSPGRNSAMGGAELTRGSSNVSAKVVRPRRPHTSAGPRDKKPYDYASGPRVEEQAQEDIIQHGRDTWNGSQAGSPTGKPGTSQSAPTKRRSFMAGNIFSASPRITNTTSGSSFETTGTSLSGSDSLTRSTSSSISSVSSDSEADDRVREWEEELAKIEILSRKSSDMLGFAGKKKRPVRAPLT